MHLIRYANREDRKFWFSLDGHLDESVWESKLRDRQCYVLEDQGKKRGLLRYNLFWDSVPFCTLLFVDCKYQKRGYGKALMDFWEQDMKARGFGMLMTSTQADEEAQRFYRKLGYRDAGGFVVNVPGYEQPMELILTKAVQ